MSAKRFNPCRITNPSSDAHTAPLQAGQPLLLVLDKPDSERYPECSWEIELKSEFLKLVGDGGNFTDADERFYRFEQIGNFKRWAEISRSFLGNVLIYAVNGNKRHFHSRVCVYLDADNIAKRRCLTVIRPSGHLCKLDSDGMLEVIIPDNDFPLQWRVYPYRMSSDGKYCLEQVRYEFLTKDDENNHRALDNEFFCEHRTFSSEPSEFRTNEHHYWFSFDEKSKLFAEQAYNGSYSATRLVFIGKNNAGECVKEYRIQVHVQVKHRSKKSTSLIVTNPTERYLNTTTRVITSPNNNEALELNSESDRFYVELIQPKEDEKWVANVTKVMLGGEQTVGLSVEEMSSYRIDNYILQKFCVKPLNVPKYIVSAALGNVEFSCATMHTKRLRFNYAKTAPYIPKTTTTSTSTYASNGTYVSGKTKKCERVEYSEVEIVDAASQSLAHGERTLSWKAAASYVHDTSYQIENRSKKNDPLNGNWNGSKKKEKTSTGNNASKNGKAGEFMVSGTSTAADESDKSVVFDPENLEIITIKDGSSCKLRLPLRKYLQTEGWNDWSVHIIQTSHAHKLKVNKGWISSKQGQLPYQEFIVQVETEPGFIGTSKVGSLRLVYGRNDVETRIVIVDVSNTSPQEKLPSIETITGHPYLISRNLLDKRVTLIDPIRPEPVAVEVAPGEQLEIILHEPEHAYKQEKDGWRFYVKMFDGVAETLSNAQWQTWKQDQVQRILFALRGDQGINGQIAIKWADDVTEAGRITLSPRERPLIADFRSRHDGGIIKLENQQDIRHICLQKWEDGQRLRIFPSDYVNIEIDNPEKYLNLKVDCNKLGKVVLNQWPLCKSVLEELPKEARDILDGAHPWYDVDGFVSPGDRPWDSIFYTLQPLEHAQPYLNDMLSAMRTIWGRRPAFPIADLQFSIPADKHFTLTKNLILELADPDYYKQQDWQSVNYHDMPDTGMMTVRSGEGVRVVLRPKWTTKDDTQTCYYWWLDSFPSWLTYLGEKQTRLGATMQEFTFHCDLGKDSKDCVSGKLIFKCDFAEYQKRFYVTGVSDAEDST